MTRFWLYPGAEVVCVGASAHRGCPSDSPLLCVGAVYTVSDVGPGYSSKSGLYVCLSEVPITDAPGTPDYQSGLPWQFRADRFRPLHDSSKQIEAMRNIMLDAATRRKVSA